MIIRVALFNRSAMSHKEEGFSSGVSINEVKQMLGLIGNIFRFGGREVIFPQLYRGILRQGD